MTAERWQEIKSIVARAAEMPVGERANLLAARCANDPDLRFEVESLLAAADAADSLPRARAAIASATGALVGEQDAQLRSRLEKVLSHQYEIIRPLGRGGMGTVYLARERALERFVAIKVLRPDLALAAGPRERFKREARIAASLSHPAILSLHSFGEIDSLWYFVMSYVRGENLAEKIRREGPLQWADAHRIFSEMADALDCAHGKGVIHRDIKPANILLDSESGRAVLADFGISKIPGAAESLTGSGMIVGTPDFMSPEQVTAAPDIDARSDIYSLGAVAYVMLTGREPFRADTPGATLYKRLLEDPVPVAILVPSVPADLSAIVQKCMSRDRTQRWASARELKDALESILAIDRLPDIVRDLPSFGAYAVMWIVGWSAVALGAQRSQSERALLLLVALVAPVGLLLHMWSSTGRTMRFADLARVAAWPPEWWSMWWPGFLRRPNDLWDRLPLAARASRASISIASVSLVLLIVMRGRLESLTGGASEAWIEWAEWGLFATAVAVVGFAFTWASRRGVDLRRAPRLLLGPTLASSGWTDPDLARFLAPVAGSVRVPDGDSPTGYLRAIRELAPNLAQSRENLGPRVVIAAECLVKAIDHRDRELSSLLRDAGPSEANRLASQLDAIDSSETGSTREHGELRELIRHQLDIVQRMQSKRELVQRERAHFVDLLRSMWTLMRSASDTHPVDADAVERLERVCAEVDTEMVR